VEAQLKRFLVMGAWLFAMTTPLHAQRADSAAFVVRLGSDTTSIERYVRTSDRLVAEAVVRSPSTVVHRLTLFFNTANQAERGTYTASRPGSSTNLGEREITVPNGMVPVVGPFYSVYELGMMRAAAAGTPRMEVPFLAGVDTVKIPFQRVGSDTLSLTNQFGEPMRAHVDARGRLLHLNTPAYVSVERLKWIDLDRLAANFAARDSVGKGMGQLSPRSTTRTTVAGANLWLDYSRPAMRGRPIWGKLVPFGAVWRTGANTAAHLSTDRTIELGGLTLAPGTYTLFLLPDVSEWYLIINRQTGMSGLERNPAQDLGRVKLTLEELTTPKESFEIVVAELEKQGRLSFSWDRTRAYIPFTVK
jgi:hypothetical protein